MYCGKCGNLLDEGQVFCDKCGQQSGGSPPPVQQQYSMLREKSEGVAAVLSFLYAGLGQIYAGKIVRGLVILGGTALILSLTFALLFPVLILTTSAELTAAGILVLILGVVAYFIVWIWNIFDAHRLEREYNDLLRIHGKRPW